MKVQMKLAGVAFMLLCLAGMQLNAQAQGPTRDPLRGLKRAISDASAPALTTTQETAITAAITAFKDALPDESDTALQAAHDAFDAAILAGNQTAITTAATVALSALAQSGGYLIAASGPVTVGVLHHLTRGWTAPLLFVIAIVALQLPAGLVAGRAGVIDPAPSDRHQDQATAVSRR